MDVEERIAIGFAEADRKRRANVPGAEVLEIDGLLLAFANVPDPPVNAVHVLSEPADPVAAFTAAEHAFRERDRPIGVDIAVGRHPSVDDAIREIGLTRLFAWPGMAVDVADLPEAVLPDGIRVEPVTDERGAAAIAHVEQAGFGSEQEIAERFYAASSYPMEGGRSFVAWDDDDPVGHGGRLPARGRDRDLRRRGGAGRPPPRDRLGVVGDRGSRVPRRPRVAPHG